MTLTAQARANAPAINSPYAAVGEKLVDLGYSAIPAMPGSKFPGEFSFKKWHPMSSWNRYCDRVPTEIETSHWKRWPDAGVCLALNHELKVIDVDTDDAAITAAILGALPESHIRKRGAKGFSIFYRGAPTIESRSFSIDRERVLDVLAFGRQTVLPPTTHPTTGEPYAWIDPDQTLLNTPPDQLPELPDDILDRIVEALEPFGYVDPPEHDPMFGDSASTWRQLNELALQRLHLWVPGLNLPDLYATREGYRAVAGFRPSGSGKADHERNQNLSIHTTGIVDWGDDAHPYTPLDLVMACHDCSFGDAVTWLRERLGLIPVRHDFSKLVANMKRKQA